jgi:hypothetical protein
MKSEDIKTVSDDFKLETSQVGYGLLTPGFSDERINTVSQTRGSDGGGTYYCGSSSRSSGSTGSQAITGVGFTPKMIVVQAVYAASDGSMSIGHATSPSGEFVVYQYNTNGVYYSGFSYVSGRIIYIQNPTGGTSSAELTSMDSDGFTLNWTGVSNNVNFMFQCYG